VGSVAQTGLNAISSAEHNVRYGLAEIGNVF
jgi:hypothetical protein